MNHKTRKDLKQSLENSLELGKNQKVSINLKGTIFDNKEPVNMPLLEAVNLFTSLCLNSGKNDVITITYN